ncbi:MAG: type 1 fimbrial protein [Neisseriaceae bacterium]|nr:type 1 fimbrial protein [Neisseriaceae bacterium]MBP6860749.1 type 1 fimbrial protein [Neisseriaceae bacterium]
MNQKTLLGFLLGFSGCLNAAQLPDDYISGTMGTVRITGTLMSSVCEMHMDTVEQSIDLGALSARAFHKTGSGSALVPIRLKFSGCLQGAYGEPGPIKLGRQFEARADGVATDLFMNGQYGATLAFVGEEDGANRQLLKVHGQTQGVGVRFMDRNGRKIDLNTRNKAYLLNPGENEMLFYAGLESTQENVRGGEFQSVVNIRVSYL